MPWRKTDVLEQRKLFIVRAELGEEPFSELCEEFGVSRKTGYKWLERYRRDGIESLRDSSRRPHQVRSPMPNEILCEVVRIKNWKPHWGGRKIRQYLVNQKLFEALPHSRTIERHLQSCGYVKPRKADWRRAYKSEELIEPQGPNDVWTLDFKGWWYMGNRKRCEPLTVRDKYSRYLLNLTAHPGTAFETTKRRFSEVFEEYGLPKVIRTDNGSPFASVHALHRLSRFGVWLMKHGVIPNRMDPASPNQNAAHERFHRDIMRELESSPAENLKQEQKRFNVWRYEFNNLRPHESLGGDPPVKHYRKSARRYRGDKIQFEYPSDFQLRKVNKNGEFNWSNKRISFAKSLADEYIGIEDTGEPNLKLWFCDFYLASLDRNGKCFTPSQSLTGEKIGRRI